MQKLVNPRPTKGNLIVKDAPKSAQHEGLIVTPEMAQKVPSYGEILQVYDGSELFVGDLAVYSLYTGHMVNLNGEEVRIISEDEILAIQHYPR